MDIIEIVLLAAGGLIFILSFLIPGKKGLASVTSEKAVRQEVRELVNQELDNIRGRLDAAADESASYAADKTERALERLSNEKIMAVSEYSDTVLAQIHKDHEEAMFLYDMLNSKHDSMKKILAEINCAVKAAEQAVTELQQETVSAAAPEEAVQRHEEETPFQEPEDALPNGAETEKINSNERILTLYKKGRSPVDIAKELELGVGEVKLVIDLFTGAAPR